MKAIILAGGQGDRLDKYSPEYTGIPKPMLPLNIFFKCIHIIFLNIIVSEHNDSNFKVLISKDFNTNTYK